MDGAPFDSRYLKMKDEIPYLTKDWDDGGIEFFIPEGTDWTWEELKNYCKNES